MCDKLDKNNLEQLETVAVGSVNSQSTDLRWDDGMSQRRKE